MRPWQVILVAIIVAFMAIATGWHPLYVVMYVLVFLVVVCHFWTVLSVRGLRFTRGAPCGRVQVVDNSTLPGYHAGYVRNRQAKGARGSSRSALWGWVSAEQKMMMPADFSAEEQELARDLNSLFPLEQEQVPPRFVQTLATENGAWVAPSGLEQRAAYQVFRRLRLPRRLFSPQVPGADDTARRPGWLGRAPRTLALSTLLALVVLSLVMVAPSFAQGLYLLLGQTGMQVAPYSPQPTFAPQEQVQYLSLQQVRQSVPFIVHWLGVAPGAYQFQGLVLHRGQPWSDGPVVELQYGLAEGAGNGQLLVREFRPAAGATVLQVVAQGAVHPTPVNNQPAIYIDGQWVHQRQAIVWKYGAQAELLYQADGLIFWITADQRDGAGEAMLEGLAQALEPLYLCEPRLRPVDLMLPANARVAAVLSLASLGEVIALIPVGVSPGTGAAVYIALGSPPDAWTSS